MSYRITVDTGGTFTDMVVASDSGEQVIGKAPTTPERIFNGMQDALEAVAGELGVTPDQLLAETSILIYGTTRATNAIVQKKVAKTAFLTTEGFPDTLVLKEGGKHGPHDFTQEFPDPYIPQKYTFEIPERMDSEGGVRKPLDTAATRDILIRLKAQKFEAVAVCLLWSIINPDHERAVGEMIAEMLPGVPYTLSHELVPIIREYRRASATAIDASLKPLMQEHLRQMESDLRGAGYDGEILVSTAIGGCMHVEELAERPIHTVKSGPAMAPVAGLNYARIENFGSDVIICDTGGTTFDVGLVRDGEVKFTRDTWIGPQWTGDILAISSVDVRRRRFDRLDRSGRPAACRPAQRRCCARPGVLRRRRRSADRDRRRPGAGLSRRQIFPRRAHGARCESGRTCHPDHRRGHRRQHRGSRLRDHESGERIYDQGDSRHHRDRRLQPSRMRACRRRRRGRPQHHDDCR